MTLNGQVVRAPAGAQGFDANTALTSRTAKQLRAAGFTFCVRYLSRKAGEDPRDLTAKEAALILDAGLALMAVQHVDGEGWSPDKALGTKYGKSAAANAGEVGLPAGVTVWLDLEGVNHATPSTDVIEYCNAWFAEVEAAGYVTGIYVGASAILSGDELFWRLKTKHYWRSGSSVPEIPHRGYQMIQRIVTGDVVAGVAIDRNVTKDDLLGDAVSWLAPAAAVADAGPVEPHRAFAADPSIDDLDLVDYVREAARTLKAKHPEIVFTSGRRGVKRQADAMAGNIVRKRRYIEQTYAAGPESQALQKWVDDHPQAVTAAAISSGLEGIMNNWTDAQKSRLSKHFSGQAFDILPVSNNAEAIKSTIRSLPNLHQFFDTEGGLTIWHAEFVKA